MAAAVFKSVNLRTIRKFSSALYITGDKAQTNFVVLTPHIDFDEQIKHREDLVKSIEARKLDIDVNKIEKRWNFFKMIDDHKNVLEVTKSEVYNVINNLKQEDPEKNNADIEKLLLHVKLIKNELKNVKDYSYGIEESANLGVLSLPNFLHKNTPIDDEIIIHQSQEQPQGIDQSHMEIGKSLNLIEYTNPMFYFLKSEASLFELATTNYFQKRLLDMGLIQFSNADFARSIVVEGCGLDHLDNSKMFTLEGSDDGLNRLHVVGGGSLYAFMAYFAKNSIQPAFLPLKFFSLGRKYTPVTQSSDLFNLSQSTVAQIFIATEDDDEKMDETFNTLVQKIIKIYEPLGFHFKLVYAPARDLEKGESLKTSIQMFSNFSQKYVEVGNLSLFDVYLSKRLMLAYNINKERKFLRIITGEVLNVQRFLGCAIENNCYFHKPLLTEELQKCL